MTTPNITRKDELILSRPSNRGRLLHRVFSDPKTLALAYLAALTTAESVTVFAEPRLGMLLHGLVLFALLAQSAMSRDNTRYRFLLALALAPLIRLLSLTMPLPSFPFVYWYFVVGGPLLLSAYLGARLCGLGPSELGLHLHGLPLQVLIGITGVGLGYVEYLILRPEPLATELTLQAIWLPALVLLVFTGLLEEVIFRGLLQHAALRNLGRMGFPYVAAVFAVLHFGYHSILDVVFVFTVALFFGWAVLRTRSIVGVTLSHGLTNITLFLVFPLLLVEAPTIVSQPFQEVDASPRVVATAGTLTPSMTPFVPEPEQIALPGLLYQQASPTQPSYTATFQATITPVPNSSNPVIEPEGVSCGPPQGWVVYKVKQGDTLYALSLAVGVSTVELMSANCLDSNLIIIGLGLFVPFQPVRLPSAPTPTQGNDTPAQPSPGLTPEASATPQIPEPSATPELPTDTPPATSEAVSITPTYAPTGSLLPETTPTLEHTPTIAPTSTEEIPTPTMETPS